MTNLKLICFNISVKNTKWKLSQCVCDIISSSTVSVYLYLQQQMYVVTWLNNCPSLGSGTVNMLLCHWRSKPLLHYIKLHYITCIHGHSDYGICHKYEKHKTNTQYHWSPQTNSVALSPQANYTGPPLWSRGQSSWLLTQRSWVRFPVLPNFLRSSGSGTGSTQPREDKWGATWKKSSSSGLENWD
jgi:hypothetical protein